MAPIWSSLYLQYKADNAKFANWLGNAAINHGFPLSNFTASPSLADGTGNSTLRTAEQERRARKKARAKSKAKGGKCGGERSERMGGDHEDIGRKAGNGGDRKNDGDRVERKVQYLISSEEYIKVAQFLVEKRIVVPEELMRLLQRCIGERMRAFRAYRDLEPSDSHFEFIKVLREVEMILEPLVKRSRIPGVTPSVASKDKEDELVNRFSALSADEDTEGEEDLADIDLPKPPRPADTAITPDIVFDQSTDVRDVVMELLLFLLNVHIIRVHIMRLWVDYRRGKIQLETAAVTTNTALALLRKTVAAFSPVTRARLAHGDLAITLQTLVGVLCPKGSGSLEVDGLLMEYVFLPNHSLIKSMGELVENGKLPLIRPGIYMKFDPLLCGTELARVIVYRSRPPRVPFEERQKHNCILLSEMFVEYFHFVHAGSGPDDEPERSTNHFFLDEIGYEMYQFVRKHNGKPTLMLLVASQFFIDIHQVLRKTVPTGRTDLRTVAKRVSSALNTWTKIDPDTYRVPDWTPEADEVMTGFQKEMQEYLGRDPVRLQYDVNAAKFDPDGQAWIDEKYSVTFFDRNPFTCGLLLFKLRLQYQNIGSLFANGSGTARDMAHLWKAISFDSYGELELPAWSEMDQLLRRHSDTLFFEGKSPHSLDEAFGSLIQKHGFTARALAVMRETFTIRQHKDLGRAAVEREMMSTKNKPSTQKNPNPINASDLVAIFRNKYIGGLDDTGSPIDVAKVQRVLIGLLRKQEETQAQGGSPVLHLRKRRRHKAPKFSVTQLLSVLEAGLEAEKDIINMDWLGLHLRCLKIFHRVHAATHHLLTALNGNIFMLGEQGPRGVVARILETTALQERLEKLRPSELVMRIPDNSKILIAARRAVAAELNEPL